jgi:hypothetical protein
VIAEASRIGRGEELGSVWGKLADLIGTIRQLLVDETFSMAKDWKRKE